MDGIKNWNDGARRHRLFRRRPRRIVIARLLMLWMFLVSVYFLWEAFRYRGLYALLSEWQFEQFGYYLPILTYGALVLLLGSPAIWLLRARQRSDSRRLADRRGHEAAVVTGSNFRRVLFAFAGGLGAAALVPLLWSLTLPAMRTPTHAITVGGPESAAPAEGPVLLRGQILYTRTAAFSQDMLFTRRGVRFAPMVEPASNDESIRYFVELPPSDILDRQQGVQASSRAGILMRNALPGSIVRLYRYAGYDVEAPYYVLYASSLTMRWPYYVTALQLCAAAIIALLAALFQHRHIRRVAIPRSELPPA